MENGFLQVVDELLKVVFSNFRIWIPVLAAWAAGFMSTRYMNLNNIRRKAEREWFVYKVNAGVAFCAYILFNYQSGIDCIQQALLAASVAVLIPAAWFWYKRDK